MDIEVIEEALLWAPHELWGRAKAELDRLRNLLAQDPGAQAIGAFGKKSPETSRKAAVALYPNSGTQRRKVFDLIRERGGLTCNEVEGITGYIHENASARIWELRTQYKHPLVEDSGLRRRTTRGKEAIVWRVTSIGQYAMEHTGEAA